MELFTRSWGSPSAPAMVLLHGVTGDGGTWAGFAPRFADRWHVIAPDQRGHGRSRHAEAYSFDLFADDLHGLLDAYDIEQAVLVGHSMGGVVAYRFAEQYPDRVAAMVLEEAPPPVPLGRELGPRPAGELDYDWALRAPILAELNDPGPDWPARLATIAVPTLVIAGGGQSHLPQADIAAMAGFLPTARLVRIEAGHLVHETRPDEFAAVVEEFLTDTNR
ncbi:alpha/beta fold hydrolase [Kutzneria sp. CA-103260]|uniref:alpha/beta fold hydrolase n=1 Tax=Kutzneria sp. CA-103260 TaxID=2802641 RepID=UPI001BEF14C2|nr:alpha/beta fold hydrolase [Kutzneria sp. CA-103260]QUQ66528.1 alpha/beta hydrolase [Kutzneria sp. CA-103260]